MGAFYSISDKTPLLKDAELKKNGQLKRTATLSRATTGRKTLIFIGCFLMQLLANGVGYSLSVMYPEIIKKFEANRTSAAMIQTLYMGILVMGGLAWTHFLYRYKAGHCCMVGIICGSICFIISYITSDLTVIITCVGVIASLSMSVCIICSFTILMWTFVESAAYFLMPLTISASVGQFLFPYMCELLIFEYSWDGTLLLLSGVILQLFPVAVFLTTSNDHFVILRGTEKNTEDKVRNYHSNKQNEDKCDKSNGSTKTKLNAINGNAKESSVETIITNVFKHTKKTDERKSNVIFSGYLFSLVKDVYLDIVLLNVFLMSLSAYMEAWFIVDMSISRGFERRDGSLLASIQGVSNLVGRSLSVVIKFKTRIPTVYHWIYTPIAIGISHAVVLIFTNYYAMMSGCILNGLSFGIILGQLPAIMLESAGDERYPVGMAIMNFLWGLGMFLGGLLGGFINDTYGDYNNMFYISITCSAFISIATIANVMFNHKH